MQHLESYIDTGIAALKAGLPTRIQAVNQTHTDFVLPTPAADSYFAGGLSTYLAFPSVELAAPDWSLANPSIRQQGWSGTATVTARILYQHADFDTLYRAVMRYGRCLTEVLAQPDALGVGQTVSSMRGFYRVDPEAGTREEFIAGALVVCSLDVFEATP